MLSQKSSFWLGIKDVSPLILGVLPFAIISGIASIEVGLSVPEAVGLAVIVFAGASQLAALQLLEIGSPVLIIVLTIAVVNLRFVMYSASLAVHFHYLPLAWKVLIGYTMTDQAYALPIAKFEQVEKLNKPWYYIGVSFTMWTTWQSGSIAGMLLGSQIPNEWSLDFTIPLIFLALLAPAVRDKPTIFAAVSSGAVAVASAGLPYNLGLILAAATGIGVGLWAEWRMR